MGRTEIIRLRVTPEEKARVETEAGDAGMSEYVRDRVLGPDGATPNQAQSIDWDEFRAAFHRTARQGSATRALNAAIGSVESS